MAKYLVEDTSLVSVADEIRILSGTTGTMGLDAMKNKVSDANENIANALSAIANKGVDVPSNANIGNLAELIDTIETAGSGGADISDSTITKETMVEGTVGYSSTGERLVGTNPYELNATNAEVAEQSDLLDQIYALLEAKSAYYTIYIGTDEPSVDLGVNGDIYIKRSE